MLTRAPLYTRLLSNTPTWYASPLCGCNLFDSYAISIIRGRSHADQSCLCACRRPSTFRSSNSQVAVPDTPPPSSSEVNKAILATATPAAVLTAWASLLPHHTFDAVNLCTAFLRLGRPPKARGGVIPRDAARGVFHATAVALDSGRFGVIPNRELVGIVSGYCGAGQTHAALEKAILAAIEAHYDALKLDFNVSHECDCIRV